MRARLGLRRPQAGSVRVFGIDALADDEASRLAIETQTGVLVQGGALFSSLSVLENIMVPLKEHHELSDDLMHALCWMKMRLAGLPSSAAEKLPAQLSGGMKKRAGLARALALDPEVVFLDEPTAGLDPIGAAAFDELILDLRRALGLTVVMVTHDLDSLARICDRIAVLVDKRIVAGTMTELMANPHPWIREYFHGPRARAAFDTAAIETAVVKSAPVAAGGEG